MGELSLYIENHLVTWNGSATFNISWIGGHGIQEDVHCFTHYGVNQSTPVSVIQKIMLEGWESYNYG
jgi:hypothetical protein